MRESIELSEWQQLSVCVRCLPWGILIGALFDINSGVIRDKRSLALLLDAGFGIVSAVITFFGALVLLDGQLHPLLFLGILSGFLLEHYTVGRLISGLFACVFYGVGYLKRMFTNGFRRFFEKIAKIFCLFSKKT